MNKETKRILNENNKLEEQLNKQNNKIYTNMVVYMRGSDISEYNQERVRRDIIEMIIEGEKRGDSIDEIIGTDYKNVCDEIISVFPSETTKDKIVNIINMTLACVYILGAISVIKTLVGNIVHREDLMGYALSMGDIINAMVIIVLANIIVNKMCKNAFKNPIIKNKIIRFMVSWIICMTITCSMIGIAYFLDFVVVKTNLIVVVLLSVVAFIVSKIISNRY
ncbi:MAG: hypothetical protein ACERKN_19460 [Velocimicrobium sp.]